MFSANQGLQTPVIRSAQPATANGDAQLDDAQYQFPPTSGKFDGTGDYVRVGTTGFQFNSGDPFTAECFFRSDGNWSASGYDALIGIGNTHASSGTSVQLYVRNISTTYTIQAARGFAFFCVGNTQVATNTWHHCALQRHANNVAELYVNGLLQNAPSTQANQVGQNSGGTIGIFADNVSVPMKGWIDEIRISNIARYSGNTITVPTEPFQNDLNTLFLCHTDGADGSKAFLDDNT